VSATFGGASDPEMAPTVAATTTVGGPPPSNTSTREALVQRVNGVSLLGNGGSGLEFQGDAGGGGIYIGGIALGMRGKDLSKINLQIEV
jgi:hypothetical protein